MVEVTTLRIDNTHPDTHTHTYAVEWTTNVESSYCIRIADETMTDEEYSIVLSELAGNWIEYECNAA